MRQRRRGLFFKIFCFMTVIAVATAGFMFFMDKNSEPRLVEGDEISGRILYTGEIDSWRFVPDETRNFYFSFMCDNEYGDYSFDIISEITGESKGIKKYSQENHMTQMYLNEGEAYIIKVIGTDMPCGYKIKIGSLPRDEKIENSSVTSALDFYGKTDIWYYRAAVTGEYSIITSAAQEISYTVRVQDETSGTAEGELLYSSDSKVLRVSMTKGNLYKITVSQNKGFSTYGLNIVLIK